jgi:hypothetical protein
MLELLAEVALEPPDGAADEEEEFFCNELIC